MRSRASGVARLRRIFSASTFLTLAHFSDAPRRTRGSASLPFVAARCSLLIALFRRAQSYSATLRLFKVESGINGLLPTSWVPSIYSVSRLSRLRSALGSLLHFAFDSP